MQHTLGDILEYRYKLDDDYNEFIIEEFDIKEKLKLFFKDDSQSLDEIQRYIRSEPEFCRRTDFASNLAGFYSYFLLYDHDELYAASAIIFNLNDDEDEIIGISIPFFCSKRSGYGSLLITRIMALCKKNNWYIKLMPSNEANTRFYEIKHGFTKKSDGYHYYNKKT